MNERITQVMLGVLILLALIAVAILQTGQRERMKVMNRILERVEAIETMAVPVAIGDEPAPPAPAPPTPAPVTGNPAPAPSPVDPPPVVAADPPPTPVVEPADDGSTEVIDIVGLGRPRPPVPPVPVPPEPEPEPVVDPVLPPDPDPAPIADADPKWQRFGPTITTVVDDLLAGRYDQVAEKFNEDMAAALDATRLAAAMNPIRQRAGAFRNVIEQQSLNITMPKPDMHPFRVVVATAKNEKLTFTITVTDAKKIAGLYIN